MDPKGARRGDRTVVLIQVRECGTERKGVLEDEGVLEGAVPLLAQRGGLSL